MPWYTPHVGPSYTPDDPRFTPIPGNPLSGWTWHLNRAAGTDMDIDVQEVWPDYIGRGVSVGIYDTAVFFDHEDLNDNYDASLHLRLSDGTVVVPLPRDSTTEHGSMVAGVIAAEDNNVGSVGVAFGAHITGVPILGRNLAYYTDAARNADEAKFVAALQHQAVFDVVNHSWGGEPFEYRPGGNPAYSPDDDPVWEYAALIDGVKYAADNGRAGLGTIVVTAAGNERVAVYHPNAENPLLSYWVEAGDGNTDAPHAASRHAVTVGAVGQDGYVTAYSNPGANLLVTAPSGDSAADGTNGLVTTRQVSGDYTTFGGTSAAAPVITGVVALMLETNPNLGWRDVKEILADSARHVGNSIGAGADPAHHELDAWEINGATNWNGGGHVFSNDYGFGLVDAHAAVRLAETWVGQKTSANELTVETSVHENTPVPIPGALSDPDKTPLVYHFNITQALDLEEVTLDLQFYHPFIDLLEVTLESPDHTVSKLLRSGTGGATAVENWKFTSNEFWGENSIGDWTLRVTDVSGLYGGGNADGTPFRRADFSGAKLKMFGSAPSADDTYVYTNDFAYLPATGEHGFVGIDQDGGVDTINAAAVTWNTTIDLQGGHYILAGREGFYGGGGTQDPKFYMIENVTTGDGEDTITGNDANNLLLGGRGNDTLDGGRGNDILNGQEGVDTMLGGAGDDTFNVEPETHQFAFDVVNGGPDKDTLAFFRFFYSSVTVDLATGVFGSMHFSEMENLSGTRFDDHLYGDAGDNVINGGRGADTMVGRGGSDTYVVDDVGDQIIEALDGGGAGGGAAAAANGAAGADVDTVQSSVSYQLPPNVEVLVLLGTASLASYGNAQRNQLTGNPGSNTLDGKGGPDVMVGLGGDDVYYVDNAGDRTIEAADGGSDRVLAAASFALEPGSEIEILKTDDDAGLPAVNLSGNEFANILYGNAGGNTLDGGGNADLMVGLSGNDWYYVDNAGDRAVEALSGGSDRVLAAASFALEPGSEIEVLKTQSDAGTSALNLSGNEFANVLYGSAGANILDGGGNTDLIVGLGGSDWYYVDNAGDRAVEALGGGSDRVLAAASFALEPGSEIEVLKTQSDAGTSAISLSGNEFANVLYGSAGANVLDGGGNADIMVGLGGGDWYYVDNAGDRAVEATGGGSDRVLAAANFVLEPGSEIETLLTDNFAGTSALNLTGNEFANVVYGNAGANILDGGGNADLMVGLSGNDWYYVDNPGDRAVEAAGGGSDRVLASVSFALEAGSEIEVLKTQNDTGTGAINLSGNAFANVLYGSAGANVLDGGGNADLMVGLGGSDVYYVDNAGDRAVEAVGGGSDRVLASGSFALEAGSEIELFTTVNAAGLEGINLAGNEFASTIIGNAGANLINGGLGNDTLVGMGGSDTFSFSGAWGKDTVTDFVHGQDVLDMTGVNGLTSISQLTIISTAQGASIAFGSDSILLQGVAAASLNPSDFRFTSAPTPPPGQTLTGTAGNDVLTGGAGNDRLEGLDGVDSLVGGAGADQLLGGNGIDFLYVDADDTLIDGGDDFDYLYLDSSKPYGASFKVVGTNVEYVGGTLASDRIDATGVAYRVVLNGNYGNDVLIGGSGNDHLDGSANDDALTGGAGGDVLHFGASWGRDTITDFTHGQDILDLAGVSGLTSMGQLSITDTAQGASIAFGGDSILLQGIAAGSLTASDFHFMV